MRVRDGMNDGEEKNEVCKEEIGGKGRGEKG